MNLNQCYFGDVMRLLPEMIGAGVHVNCITTSIPYWAQRDYRIPPVIWGGDPEHAHVWVATGKVGGGGRKHTAGSAQHGRKQREQHESLQHVKTGDVCECGAWRGQFGLERRFDCLGWATGEPCGQCYICHVTGIFDLLMQVLAQDGSAWLNVGDSYNNQAGQHHLPDWDQSKRGQKAGVPVYRLRQPRQTGIKPKDILAQPWHIGLALRARGWYLRRPIIWHKKNCMPSSVKDRTTEDYEYLLLLTRSRRYFYDWVAIAEPTSPDTHARAARGRSAAHKYADGGPQNQTLARVPPSAGTIVPGVNPKAQGFPSGWDGASVAHRELGGRYPAPRVKQNMDFSAAVSGHNRAIRNKRSVWSIATEPFHGKHYATFPRALVTPCILAGTSAHGHCPQCGAGWKRITTKGNRIEEWQRLSGGGADGKYNGKSRKDYAGARAQDASETKARILDGMREILTIGWYPTCKCYNAEALPREPKLRELRQHAVWERKVRRMVAAAMEALRVVRAIVLDPFAGSNTSGSQAERLGRDWLAIEINPNDKENQVIRFAQTVAVKRRRGAPPESPEQLPLLEGVA